MRGPESSIRCERRSVLAAAGVGFVGSPLVRRSTDSDQRDSPEPAVTFEDQESDGTTVVVAEVATDVEALLMIQSESGAVIAGGDEPIRFEAGEVAQDIEIELAEFVTETQELIAHLNESNDGSIAEDSALVSVSGSPPSRIEGRPVTPVDADPDAGFNYPYFLYAPDVIAESDPKPILVQPNNTGEGTDDFERHREAARNDAEGSLGRQVSDELGAPLLVPVFPRPHAEPVDGTHYVHQLDATTMSIEDGPLERVDLQLVRMVEHAKQRLSERDYPVAEGIMLNGFSASGNFVDRFSALHPDRVVSVTAGGINGMAILPVAEAKGHTLDYHIGVADLEALTGEPFDRESFVEVNKFLYMGELDSNDTIPFGDAWTDEGQREIALEVYGDDMQAERLPYCRSVYDDVGADAVFRIYEGVGHSPRAAVSDVIEFHRRSLAGDDIEATRADLGGNVPDPNANFECAPEGPLVGEQVAFDASGSAVWDRELVEFAWEFGDGETATGVRTSHTYDSPGGYNVVLTVTDDAGETYEAARQIAVDRKPAFGSVALGLSGAIAGFGSLGYVLLRRLADRSDE